MATQKLKIGLLGCGTVGGGLVELIHKNNALIRQRCGVELSITKILVRDPVKERPGVDRALITTHPEKVINNGCDLVVELVGGIDPARKFIQRSLAGNKHVVTANKSLLAVDGYSLMKAAEIQKVRLGFEASVCGGIPIIRALRNGLVGNRIQSLAGILNGTCNYILTRMTEQNIDFDAALAEAQAKGFAEADPALDIDGHDAAQKLKILAELAFNGRIDTANVRTEGIRHLTSADVCAARELGYVIKHVAAAQTSGDSVAMRVAPVLLTTSHPLAGVREENNAVVVRGDAVGEMVFSGKGAGSLPSASAVLSDIVDIACYRNSTDTAPQGTLAAIQSDDAAPRYLRFPVANPSAIGPITTVLERNGIAITRAAAVWGKNGSEEHHVRMLIHSCADAALDTALREVTRRAIDVAPVVSLSICG
ncbi:MAG TPA: homoserine dehydrogenase [Terriglobales bacterium]|jgi:homoserine dehydrogenase